MAINIKQKLLAAISEFFKPDYGIDI